MTEVSFIEHMIDVLTNARAYSYTRSSSNHTPLGQSEVLKDNSLACQVRAPKLPRPLQGSLARPSIHSLVAGISRCSIAVSNPKASAIALDMWSQSMEQMLVDKAIVEAGRGRMMRSAKEVQILALRAL